MCLLLSGVARDAPARGERLSNPVGESVAVYVQQPQALFDAPSRAAEGAVESFMSTRPGVTCLQPQYQFAFRF